MKASPKLQSSRKLVAGFESAEEPQPKIRMKLL